MAVEEDEAAGIPEWVVTFGDMMSLLLTFFIMLVSLSEIKQAEKYQALVDSMRKRFGHDSSSASMAPGDHKPRNAKLQKLATMGRARRAHTFDGGDKVRAPVGEHPHILSPRHEGKRVAGGVLLFDADSATLTEKDKRDLQTIALEIGGKRQKIEIRGHTSNVPLPADSKFKNKWQLAYQRCTATMKFLESMGIDQKRMRLAVAGPHEPARIGEDPSLLKINDRVEVFLLAEVADDLQGTREEKAKRYVNEDVQNP